MPEYKLYAFGSDGRFDGPAVSLVSPDDGAALRDAARMVAPRDGELWIGRRLVGRLERPAVAWQATAAFSADRARLET